MTLNRLIAFYGCLGPPFTSFDQSNSPTTRDNPTGEQTQYPRDIQEALARLHAQDRWPRVRRDR